METLKKELESKGYKVYSAMSKEQARQILLHDLEGVQNIGIGGSMSVQELDIVDALKESGKQIYWHWLPTENGLDARKMAAAADVYLASANAITQDGKLLFIDGTGNRTAAVAYGPKRVILIIGKNKLTEDVTSGFARVRKEACPLNAKRLKLQTPCALTGKCTGCTSPQRMCNVFLTLERCPDAHPVEIILVEESVGY